MTENETVLFGSYYQSDPARKEPIEWIVIEKTDTYATLISKSILCEKAFDEETAAGWTWRNSTLRSWLNSEFLNEAFSASEQRALLPDEDGCPVFILNSDEAGRLMTEEQRAAVMTGSARDNGIFRDDCWWVCSRGYSDFDTVIVKADGRLNPDAYDRFSSQGCGVRPCVRITLSAVPPEMP
ncbi:MAG: hypothetical protein IKD93_04645 [Firmicutes bacterium]|nr:hypothetical protein [Bacillota bacterium]